MIRITKTLSLALAATMSLSLAVQASPVPKYKADIPAGLLTPDKVETKLLGELTFQDGMPSEITVQKSYDFLDTARASETFLTAIPAVSLYSMLEGCKSVGADVGDLVLFDKLMDARTLFLTAQTTTPYGFAEIDVKNGPVVVEIPAMVLGFLDNAAFLHVSDMGVTGPDKGKGGKYLVVGPDYKGEIPEGYFVVHTKTYRHWLLMRVFVKDGDVASSVIGLKEDFKAYPLSQAANPPKQKIVYASGKQFNTIHSNNITFYDELNAIVQYEPENTFKPEHVGLFASIGIKKGQKFAPDARMKAILTDGVAIGNATARSITFRPRNESVYFFPGKRQWYSPLAGQSSEFMNNAELVLDDRTMFHYYATGITPAMAKPMLGKGSVYAIAAHDANNSYLDGSKTYKVTMKAPVPVNNFWSFMVYNNQTRSILETDQKSGGIDSNAKGLVADKDGSVTVYFAPKAPKGHEKNWVQTTPGKGFNVLLRLYGPLQPWFDKTWMPSDFEVVE